MSEYFDKNIFVHERDENENLLPIDITTTIKNKEGKTLFGIALVLVIMIAKMIY